MVKTKVHWLNNVQFLISVKNQQNFFFVIAHQPCKNWMARTTHSLRLTLNKIFFGKMSKLIVLLYLLTSMSLMPGIW